MPACLATSPAQARRRAGHQGWRVGACVECSTTPAAAAARVVTPAPLKQPLRRCAMPLPAYTGCSSWCAGASAGRGSAAVAVPPPAAAGRAQSEGHSSRREPCRGMTACLRQAAAGSPVLRAGALSIPGIPGCPIARALWARLHVLHRSWLSSSQQAISHTPAGVAGLRPACGRGLSTEAELGLVTDEELGRLAGQVRSLCLAAFCPASCPAYAACAWHVRPARMPGHLPCEANADAKLHWCLSQSPLQALPSRSGAMARLGTAQ